MGLRVALIRQSDNLVTQLVDVTPFPTEARFRWEPPPGNYVVLAQQPDGSYRYVGPGFRYDPANNEFLRPAIEAPLALPVGVQATLTLRWRNENGQPVAYVHPIHLRITGPEGDTQMHSYDVGPDGGVTVPIVINAPGAYRLEVIEPEMDVVLDSVVVVVQ